MGAIRYSCASALLLATVAAAPTGAGAELRLEDAPVVWYEDDRAPVPIPAERDPGVIADSYEEGFSRPVGRATNPDRLIYGPVPAANVNGLGEVPNSSWFTNRIGLFPMSTADAARGPGGGTGPDRSAPWKVVGVKTEGVTPGFTIQDARGDRYLIKFDPPGLLGTTTAAGAISARIFHTAGYNVPDDNVVTFTGEDLVVAEGTTYRDREGVKHPLDRDTLNRILEGVEPLEPNLWLAISSRFLPGKPVGPFNWFGKRKDDPNDHVDHQKRRELRGARLFSAWVNHFDTKQQNTLDMYVGAAGEGYVRHHLIDFASTLGCGADGLNPRFGHEYTVDAGPFFGRFFTLGGMGFPWETLERPPGLPEVCYFASADFRPEKFEPLLPNTAFADMTDEDGYWAAKIISAFTDEHLQAIVAEGKYRDPAAAAYVTGVLLERRDIIARYYFDRVAPLDFFRREGDAIVFRDLGVERGIYGASTSRYRGRAAAVTEEGTDARWSAWVELEDLRLTFGDGNESPGPASSTHPFRALEFQVDRGEGWSKSITAYVARGSGRLVAVRR
jgi:hypothetical protein